MPSLSGSLPLAFSDLDGQPDIIDDALLAIREHLDMPVAYLTEFGDGEMVFRNVSAPGLEHIVKAGDHFRLSESYCQHIANGSLPKVIPDTNEIPLCQELAITHAVPIRSHVSVPIQLDDGEVYGTFCCLSHEPKPSLNDRDLTVLSTFATLVTRQLNAERQQDDRQTKLRQKVQDILKDARFHAVYQPLVDLQTRELVGVEALCRFETPEPRGPELWFLDAEEIGLGLELELATLEASLQVMPLLPKGVYLSLNVSPELVESERLGAILPLNWLRNIVLEVTEQSPPSNEGRFISAVGNLQARGLKIAVDDVGTGYSGLQRIFRTRPDILKIDRSIVHNLHENPWQAAVVAALVHLAQHIDCKVLAEGVERIEEADALADLGVTLAQGWLFGHPGPIDAILP